MVESAQILGLTERVRGDIYRHVFGNPDREVGGVLVGIRVDAGVSVRGTIPALEAVGERAAVTFTHDAWEIVHRELDHRFPDQQIVGWYHSHPGFGIFLSRDDLFIHESFFSEPWQFAYVIDPIGLEEGEFCWRGGRVTEVGRRSISAPPGFRLPVKAPQVVAAPPNPPPEPWPTGGENSVYLRPPAPEFPLAGVLTSLAIGVLAGFLVAPALGIGSSGSSPKAASPRPARVRPAPTAVGSRPAVHETAKPVSRPPRPSVTPIPPPAATKTVPPVKGYLGKGKGVSSEKERYGQSPEYSPGTEYPTGETSGVEAGGTEAPSGHFDDE